MSRETSIEWCHHTFNIAWGCQEVSEGCDNCYARVLAKRYGHDVWGPPRSTKRRTFGEEHWRAPLKWNREAEEAGERRRVFCESMGDVFEAHRTVDAEREKLWPLIRATPALDWMLLTKRPERIRRHLPADWGPKGYQNVWMGTSIESQEYTRRAIRLVKDVAAPVLFLSVEPMLGPVDLTQCVLNEDTTVDALPALGLVICGGESGAGNRPIDPEWAVDLRAQCDFAGVPFFMKQMGSRWAKENGSRDWKGGSFAEFPVELRVREMPREETAA